MTELPDGVPEHLLRFLDEEGIAPDFLAPGIPMPTVQAAAAAIGVPAEQILKTLLFSGEDGAYVVAIANGVHRIDRRRLAEATAIRKPRPAPAADVLAVTGYPAGGVAPLALPASLPVVLDVAAAALPCAYGGGGREDVLLRVRVADVIRCNGARVAHISERQDPPGR